MNTPHTPGPWKVTSDPCHFGTRSSIVGGKHDKNRKFIKWQLMAEVGGYAEWQEQEANTRLMAAAPELLHALEMVRDADNDCKRDGLPTIIPIARRTIDMAIAKAFGKGESMNAHVSIVFFGEFRPIHCEAETLERAVADMKQRITGELLEKLESVWSDFKRQREAGVTIKGLWGQIGEFPDSVVRVYVRDYPRDSFCDMFSENLPVSPYERGDA